MESPARVRIGISACLLGANVRFDGGHKRDRFLEDVLGPHVEWVPVCPEVESGLGTPREAMRLVETARGIRLRTVRSGQDKTDDVRGWSAQRLETIGEDDVCGFILKKDSPSCGVDRVKVYRPSGMAARTGRGLFADMLRARYPMLPVEEEGRLTDPCIRENFVERIFAFRRLTTVFTAGWSCGDVVSFHTAHKLTLMAHAPAAYRRLGQLVAGAAKVPGDVFAASYSRQFMAALAVPPTAGRHANVLMHMLGYFKRTLDRASRAELQNTIEQFARGFLPLVVPITLFKHHIRREGVGYLAQQVYLQPHPVDLMLRNYACR